MKKLTAILAAVGFVLTGYSQDVPETTGFFKRLYQDVEASGLLSASNYAVEPYYTYAPKAPTKNGGGVLAVYNVNNYVGLGLGIDYLGQFSLVSANVSLRVPTKPLAFLGSQWAKDLTVTPFVLAGTGKPMSGTGTAETVALIEDAGFYIGFGHLWGGQLNVGACYGSWQNAGAYSGERTHLFLGWSKGF